VGLRLLACWYCGSKPPKDMDVCRFWVLCIIRQWSLRGADHSSRGFLQCVVCLRASWSLENEETLAQGCLAIWKVILLEP
jgi:hypothetical protein